MALRTPILVVAVITAAALTAGCEYMRLLRPSVLKQLDPDVVELVNELPEVDRQNKAIIGRLFPHGGLSHAQETTDGRMSGIIRIPKGQLIWEPAIIVMPHPGELRLDFINEDSFSHHAALLPSNGDRQYLPLPTHTRGQATLRLDGPGYYWFGCPVANHAGRGMLGLILVRGDVPDQAKLDRPAQPRP